MYLITYRQAGIVTCEEVHGSLAWLRHHLEVLAQRGCAVIGVANLARREAVAA